MNLNRKVSLFTKSHYKEEHGGEWREDMKINSNILTSRKS